MRSDAPGGTGLPCFFSPRRCLRFICPQFNFVCPDTHSAVLYEISSGFYRLPRQHCRGRPWRRTSAKAYLGLLTDASSSPTRPSFSVQKPCDYTLLSRLNEGFVIVRPVFAFIEAAAAK